MLRCCKDSAAKQGFAGMVIRTQILPTRSQMTVQYSQTCLLVEGFTQGATEVLFVEVDVAGQNAIAVAWQNRLINDASQSLATAAGVPQCETKILLALALSN